MKKTLCLLLCITLSFFNFCACGQVQAATLPSPNITLRYDINLDNQVNLLDCTLAAQIAAGWEPANVQTSRADINGDGVYNLKDVVRLVRVIMGVDCWKNNTLSDDAYDWPELELKSAEAGAAFTTVSDVKSVNGSIKKFTFSTKNNRGLSFNIACNIKNNIITALLPAGTDLTALVPEIETDKKLYCNGHPVLSGYSSFNFTKPVVLQVGAANANEHYEIYVRTLNTGLPSVSIATTNYEVINSKLEKKNCTVFMGGGDRARNGEYAFETNDTLTLTGTVKNRGWTSWYIYPKKSFTLKFDKSTSILGLGKNKEYVLAANYPDRSLIRNAVAMELAHAVDMEFVMDVRFVDLWVNGSYMGNYQLLEKIEVGKNRVNITDFDENISPENMGYIVETNGHNKASEFGTFTNGQDADRPNSWQKINSYATYDPFSGDIFFNSKHFSSIFNVNKPSDGKLMKLSEEKRNSYLDYIYNYMDTMEAAIHSGSYAKTAQYLDIDAMARWYIVEELTMNTDSRLHCSCYMYKDAGQKMKMGPVWDFDMGLGNGKYANEAHTAQPYLDNSTWFEKLTKMPEFRAKVKEVWNSSITKIEALDDFITDTAAMMETSQAKNFALWPMNDYAEHSYEKTTGQITDYAEQIEYLRDIVSARTDYMNLKLGQW